MTQLNPIRGWQTGIGAACLLFALVLSAAGNTFDALGRSSPPKPTGGFVVDQATLGNRLRVGSRPGDLGLRNHQVTAIVTKADGWLVDFWTNRPVRPTSAQLESTTNADGMWQLSPLIDNGKKAVPFSYEKVELEGDSIVAEANLSWAGVRFRVQTRYQLNGTEPEVMVESRISHLEGGRVQFDFEEALKWGNADYYVEGNPEPLNNYDDKARWIGRHGLCGDLKWTRLDAEPFQLKFRQSYPGLAPQIIANYGRVKLGPGDERTFTRKLSYEPIVVPISPAAPQGVLRASVTDENGRALAAKLSFRGRGSTKTPDFGSDGDETGASRFVWSGTGQFERSLPVGSYTVTATAGPERDAQTWDIEVQQGRPTEITGQLPRLLPTPGWISGDLHLHQVASVDADVAHTSRLVAVAAEGIELAVATDHYAVTDLAPALAHLVATGQLARPLATMVGSEISTVGNRFGHFNLFPMSIGDSVNYENTTAKAMFAEMRQVAPDAVLQVNHPRMPEIGYFQTFEMDPKSHRIPYKYKDDYVDDFDALEVFNGLDAYSHPKVRLVLRDWISLLGQGHRYTATGNSDSHKLAFQDPGLPRNLIRHGLATDDEQDVHVSEAAIVSGIKQGRVMVTNGPYIDVRVGDLGPGDTVKSGGKPVAVDVEVRAVPWVDVSHVEVLVGPKANRLRYVPVSPSRELVRYEETVKVPGYAKTFVIVVAVGKKPLDNVYATGVQPLAFTNPIWIEP